MFMTFLLWFCAGIAALVLFTAVFPYPVLRLLVCILRVTCYRVRVFGLENIPKSGPVLIVSNHVSLLDALILIGTTKRHIRFMMHRDYYRMRGFRWFFRRLRVIEVPPGNHPKEMAAFMKNTRSLLAGGEIICAFPEGGVSGNGLINDFKNGLSQMLPECPVAIIPVRLGMLWGSVFSFHEGKLHFLTPRCFPIPVAVTVGPPAPRDITAFQLRQLISEMGADTEKEPFPGERPIHAQFMRLAKRRKRKCSFSDFDKPTRPTNFEMLVRSVILSRHIRRLDPVQSEYIGVLLPNCTTAAAAVLGVLYADRVPAMLNFTAGERARGLACEKAKLRLILTSRAFLAKLSIEPTEEMVMLEDLAGEITRSEKIITALQCFFIPWRLLLRKVSPLSRRNIDRLAVLLFSSGSTGEPKGIMLTHHNVISNFFSFWRIINWTPRDRTVGNLPLFHAYGFMIGMVLPAVSGTPTCYIPNPIDAGGVCRLVETEKPTLLMATPTFMQHYMRKYKPGQFDSLRLVVTGAEKLRRDIAAKFHELTGLNIVEGFGCTELSPIVAINLSSSIFTLGRESGKPDSIGAPLPGIHVKIVDPDSGEELAPNTPGMMLVKGGLVMKGYLDDPAATAKVLCKNYYNTGDVAAMSPDGYITITGRLARFSKIGGEMVPHELVEMAINEILETEDRCIAVCGGRDAAKGEKLMVFYSVATLDPAEIISELRKRELPNIWIPKQAEFYRIDHLPLLGSGKLDLQKLQAVAEALDAAS